MIDLPDHAWKSWVFYNKGWYFELGRAFRLGDPLATIAVKEFFADLASRMGVVLPTDWTKAIQRLQHEQFIGHFGTWKDVMVALYGPEKAKAIDVKPISLRQSSTSVLISNQGGHIRVYSNCNNLNGVILEEKKELERYALANNSTTQFWTDPHRRFEYISFLQSQLAKFTTISANSTDNDDKLASLYSVQQHSFVNTNGTSFLPTKSSLIIYFKKKFKC